MYCKCVLAFLAACLALPGKPWATYDGTHHHKTLPHTLGSTVCCLTSKETAKISSWCNAGTPDSRIAQKPVRLHSPAPQCPSAPAPDWELLSSGCPNTLQMPQTAQRDPWLAGTTQGFTHYYFFAQVPCKLSPQAIFQRGAVGFVDYPSTTSQSAGERESTEIFPALRFVQSCHCVSLLLFSVKEVLMSDISYVSFFSHTCRKHLGSFVTQFNIIVTTTLV